MRLDSWTIFIAAVIASAGTTWLLWRGRLPRRAVICLGGALICLSLAAGGLSWQWRGAGDVVVMVDLSPSTRTAAYRDGTYLQQRIGQLLGHRSHSLIYFADRNHFGGGIPAQILADMPADQTHYAPPAGADAVLLFSDARFALPAAGPAAYIVADPSLEQAGKRDSAVTDLRIETDRAIATVRGAGSMENGKWTLENGSGGGGRIRGFVMAALPANGRITARVDGNDAWPENDALSVIAPGAWASQRWWVGANPPPLWRSMTAGQLPQDPAQWLLPAVVVLNDVPDSKVSAIGRDRLAQYVRDLGGGLVFCGPGAGRGAGHAQSDIRSLCPLSDDPPRPLRQWVILLDASGSMNESAGGQSRWQWAQGALRGALGAIPSMDQVDVGGFSDSVRWWVRGKSARETRGMRLPPADTDPHGPTNLKQSLEHVIGVSRGGQRLPVDVVILTDAEAQMDDAVAMAGRMRAADMHLWVLATQHGSALGALRQISQETGGAVLQQSRLDQWSKAMTDLIEKARGPQVRRESTQIRFEGKFADLPPRDVSLWREAWLKQGADRLAGVGESQDHTIGAYWQVGLGRTAAAAFTLNGQEVKAMVDLVAARPSDPRLKTSWRGGASPLVRVNAVDGAGYLNDLKLTLSLRPADGGDTPAAVAPIPQTGPGEYALKYAAPRHETIATVLEDGRTIDRIALAGRYAPEFDAVGNDHAAMERLAHMTGGDVISSRQTSPIRFHRPVRRVSLQSWMGIFGAALIAAAIVWYRMWQ